MDQFNNKEINRIIEKFANLSTQPLNLEPCERSFEYYKGFYDATYQFMQTFEKLIDSGVLYGTTTNANN